MLCSPVFIEEVDVVGVKPFDIDFSDALLRDPKEDVDTILRRAAQQITQAKKLYPIVTEIECFSDSEPASPIEPQGPIRILMLHGYTQSGEFFNSKTRKLREGIIAGLKDELALQYTQGVEFLYPDAPHLLLPSDIPGHESVSADTDELHGWFNFNDQPFAGLEQSLSYIIDYMRSVGPIDGVIGFSQGGAMAMMIASLCEGQTNPARLEALAKQPISMTYQPPQGPMKFAISMSGFRGTTDHYSGFYNPIIETPAMCIVAELDTMIGADLTDLLIEHIQDPKVVRHRGGHYVPTDKKSLNSISEFIRERMAEAF